jgi:hypothetical protein
LRARFWEFLLKEKKNGAADGERDLQRNIKPGLPVAIVSQ